MAEDKRTAPGEKPRRRPAPTIDLTATEVQSAKPSESAQPAAAPDPAPEPPRAHAAPPPLPPPRSRLVPHLFTAALSIALVGGLFAALWLGGYLSSAPRDEAALKSRIAELEQKIAALSVRPPAPAETRDVEVKAAAADPAVAARIAAIESSLNKLGAPLTALNSRVESLQEAIKQTPLAQAVEGLGKRLEAIEQSARTTQQKVAENSGADAAARQALSLFALRDAVSRNAPYAAELAAVKNLGGDSQSLAALEPFATTGVPSDAALSRELATLIPAMIKAAGAEILRSGGFVERLQANASRLVRIRPIGEPAGADPAAVLARIEVKAARNDVGGAAQEIAALPEKARALAEPWGRKVAARNAALEASRKLTADSAAALGTR